MGKNETILNFPRGKRVDKRTTSKGKHELATEVFNSRTT